MHHALIAAFATAVVVSTASIQSFELIAALGIYPSLIASNCLVLSVMEEIADRNSLARTMAQGVRDVVYVVVFISFFGLLREFGAYGAVLTDLQLVTGVYANASTPSVGPIPLLASAPGALLALALCVAGAGIFARRRSEPEVTFAVPVVNRRSNEDRPNRSNSGR